MSSNYLADLYDLATPAQFRGDADWYVAQAIAAGSPVLELGAGTGRVALPIARAGVEISALDLDAGMLAALRAKLETEPPEIRKRVTVVPGDMREFSLDDRYTLVLAPFRAFLHNLTREDQLDCLRCAHRHLQPGGSLALNVFHPSLQFMSRHSGALEGVWRWTGDVALADGGTLVRSEANRYDTVRQLVSSRHRFERYDAQGALVQTQLQILELAYLYPGDLRRLLADAGFDRVEIFGDFAEGKFDRDDSELVVRARRP